MSSQRNASSPVWSRGRRIVGAVAVLVLAACNPFMKMSHGASTSTTPAEGEQPAAAEGASTPEAIEPSAPTGAAEEPAAAPAAPAPAEAPAAPAPAAPATP